ncbi:MAG: signal peptidase I [Clostridia bacterium]
METQVQKKASKNTWQREALSWLGYLLCAVLIAFVIRTVIAEPLRVQGNSMLDTLENDEIMMVTKLDYLLGAPQRFDVVVCHYPNRTETFVKRIVGLPGDEISLSEGVLSVNGVVYPEEYLTHRPNYTLQKTIIPDDSYFVLGDNRSNSNDSHLVGSLQRDQILGHVQAVIFPFQNWRAIQ